MIEDPASLRQQEPCLVLVRDSVGNAWSHLGALCSTRTLFDVVPDGVVVPAPHGIGSIRPFYSFRRPF